MAVFRAKHPKQNNIYTRLARPNSITREKYTSRNYFCIFLILNVDTFNGQTVWCFLRDFRWEWFRDDLPAQPIVPFHRLPLLWVPGVVCLFCVLFALKAFSHAVPEDSIFLSTQWRKLNQNCALRHMSCCKLHSELKVFLEHQCPPGSTWRACRKNYMGCKVWGSVYCQFDEFIIESG